jgi:hypothetical protein
MDKLRIEESIVLYNKNHKEKINQTILAERIKYKNFQLGTKKSYISQAISGTKELKQTFIKELCRVLEVSSDYLLGISDFKYTLEMSTKRLTEKITDLKKDSDSINDTFLNNK